MPHGASMPRIAILAPSYELLSAYKTGSMFWSQYERLYWNEVADRCKATPAIRRGAKELVSDGEAGHMRDGCLFYILRTACARLGTDEITLCCWEKADDPHCHRKLIYDALPVHVRGSRL